MYSDTLASRAEVQEHATSTIASGLRHALSLRGEIVLVRSARPAAECGFLQRPTMASISSSPLCTLEMAHGAKGASIY